MLPIVGFTGFIFLLVALFPNGNYFKQTKTSTKPYNGYFSKKNERKCDAIIIEKMLLNGFGKRKTSFLRICFLGVGKTIKLINLTRDRQQFHDTLTEVSAKRADKYQSLKWNRKVRYPLPETVCSIPL